MNVYTEENGAEKRKTVNVSETKVLINVADWMKNVAYENVTPFHLFELLGWAVSQTRLDYYYYLLLLK
jgi:hypothetical protein